ncbi:monovalent cation/H+ antiporter subunit E [Corynebacterium kutscheri]|uniref:Monovalent cation/H+ antiporter subunit E n=1 Tax=Corynebacterium kutscheri TaxID=35755 RepID=A0A0F6R1P9_9CORY|nr:Na+/H+ antiporter subunit E [Corynebacterium kutscheri]AKE41995.1 multisubunit sodium/proton antiporter, MrpE subunit [Corynebacterium kutscheri]VEH06200.1 monovalent cation/H+ antiporter subunit E [Corynebacterium kutscheri]VEH10336.1 monovalent cation/H+ antiporter subunit E [Corynebacterium kutscheri]VEH82116.1 monovalent cation/H+ antiporter subunit E [Corynebacterium kutscheri]
MIQGFRRRFRPGFILWVILLWSVLMGEFSLANALAGMAVSLIIVAVLPLPAIPTEGITIRIWPTITLFSTWFISLFTGAVRVAWLTLSPQDLPKTAILKMPMRVENELILALATGMYNLQPGGTVTDIDVANRTWTIHIINGGSDQAIAREIAAVADLERRMIRSFERSIV